MSNLNWVLKKIEGDELIEIRRKEDGLLIADAYGIGYARLIAAAPELLEALEALFRLHQDEAMLLEIDADRMDKVLYGAEAAIAKARGEA